MPWAVYASRLSASRRFGDGAFVGLTVGVRRVDGGDWGAGIAALGAGFGGGRLGGGGGVFFAEVGFDQAAEILLLTACHSAHTIR